MMSPMKSLTLYIVQWLRANILAQSLNGYVINLEQIVSLCLGLSSDKTEELSGLKGSMSNTVFGMMPSTVGT